MNRFQRSYYAYLIDGYFWTAQMPKPSESEILEKAKRELIESYQRSIEFVKEITLEELKAERARDFPNYKRTTREV